MNIGLMGFDFSNPNKGCEALSYSFVNMMNEIASNNLTIHVFGYSPLGIFPESYPEIKFVWHRLNMKNPLYWLKLKKTFDQMDCIFDITYGDGFSDVYGKIWNCITNLGKEIANRSRSPFVLLPQTYGPYYNKPLKKWAYHLVKNADVAFARDEISTREINSKIGEKVKTATDLAFALPYDKAFYRVDDSYVNVGINVSSLLWDGGHNIQLKTDYKKYCRNLLQQLSLDDRIKVHLIPHVIDTKNESSLENDSRICKLLHEEFPETILAPDFDTPIQAKSYISNMKVFIGARMHSTIGAMSSGVPVIPFSYSKKFEGLFGNLDYPYLISATKIETKEAVKLTLKYIQERDILEQRRIISMGDIDRKLVVVRKEIKRVLSIE